LSGDERGEAGAVQARVQLGESIDSIGTKPRRHDLDRDLRRLALLLREIQYTNGLDLSHSRAEITLRADRRIGKIRREIEKAPAGVVTSTGVLYHDRLKYDWATATCGRICRPTGSVSLRFALAFGERSGKPQAVDLPSITAK
jgi:hypothetical protein